MDLALATMTSYNVGHTLQMIYYIMGRPNALKIWEILVSKNDIFP
jgi:hypothetical protein